MDTRRECLESGIWGIIILTVRKIVDLPRFIVTEVAGWGRLPMYGITLILTAVISIMEKLFRPMGFVRMCFLNMEISLFAKVARTSNNTLELSQDDTGLYYRAMLSDTQAGKDLYTMIKRGDISQSSFAFTIGRESVDDEGVRVIEQVSNLIDVSPVTYPAYQAASVFARSESEFEND